MADGDKIDADEGFDPRRWASRLTYAEIHAAAIGAGLLFLAALANSEAVFFLYLGVAIDVLRDPAESDGETSLRFAGKLRRQIHREFPYYVGGGVAGDRLGAGAYWLVHDRWPTYYEEIPQVVEALLGGIV